MFLTLIFFHRRRADAKFAHNECNLMIRGDFVSARSF
jgi:hypothetical protein